MTTEQETWDKVWSLLSGDDADILRTNPRAVSGYTGCTPRLRASEKVKQHNCYRVLIVRNAEVIALVGFESVGAARHWIADHAVLLYPNALFKIEEIAADYADQGSGRRNCR